MILKEVTENIERYLQKNDTHPRMVNVNNAADMEEIVRHFSVGDNFFKSVSDFSRPDDNLPDDAMYSFISNAKGNVFLTGFTAYFRLLGEKQLRDFINRMVGMSLNGLHLVIICYQCEDYAATIDVRYKQFFYTADGDKPVLPQLVFVAGDVPVPDGEVVIEGISHVASCIEQQSVSEIFVHTCKHKSSYPHSMYAIKELRDSFEVLCGMDDTTKRLSKEYGTEQEWDYALSEIRQNESWAKYFMKIFGMTTNLELLIGNWKVFDERKRWLFFIALKLYGAKTIKCLEKAIEDADSYDLLVRGIYRSLLKFSHDDKDFWIHYNDRKNIIQSLGDYDFEVKDYCSMVRSKGRNALYYLTDLSKREKNMIFETLAEYSYEIGRDRIYEILSHVYADLYSYLQPYRFRESLLDSYFQDYKYQKVINKIFPDFLKTVDEQAEKRDFNRLLSPRISKLDAIEKKGTIVYFVDAMGVEYLSFILSQCKLRKLNARVTVCRCELPSITCKNKEFVDVLSEGGAVFAPDKNGVKELDELKHHGEEEFDFTNNELPTYISRELEIIGDVIKTIATHLMNDTYKRAVMIADHGASRLSVLSKSENKWGSESNAEHSGRCCPVSEIGEKPSCATEENGYWVLANYDRFRGGRRANVEVHGGASLEEVAVPIIEIAYAPEEIEIDLQDKNITFSRRKKDAVIKIFSKSRLDNLNIQVSGLDGDFEGESIDGQTFTVPIPELQKEGRYTFDVYTNNELLKSGLEFQANNSDFGEKELL